MTSPVEAVFQNELDKRAILRRCISWVHFVWQSRVKIWNCDLHFYHWSPRCLRNTHLKSTHFDNSFYHLPLIAPQPFLGQSDECIGCQSPEESEAQVMSTSHWSQQQWTVPPWLSMWFLYGQSRAPESWVQGSPELGRTGEGQTDPEETRSHQKSPGV